MIPAPTTATSGTAVSSTSAAPASSESSRWRDDLSGVSTAARKSCVCCQERQAEPFRQSDVAGVVRRQGAPKRPQPLEQKRDGISLNAQLREPFERLVGHGSWQARVTDKPTQGGDHLDVDQARTGEKDSLAHTVGNPSTHCAASDQEVDQRGSVSDE